jgi:4-hydroxy-tetrahydrodipicolinate reductase
MQSMTTRIVIAGATGWVGRALVAAVAAAPDLALVGAVSRGAAGQDAGEAAGIGRLGVPIHATLAEALNAPSDVVIDYTKPDAVKHHTLTALAHGRHVVVGTSGLSAEDYARIDTAAQAQGRGVLAAGNFSITATLMRRFALEAARYVPDVEIIDYASPKKADTPSGTARELAEMLGAVRQASTAKPVAELSGVRETRGGAIGEPHAVQVHSLRMPSFVLFLRGGARRRQRAHGDPA